MIQPLWKTVRWLLKELNIVTLQSRNSTARYVPKKRKQELKQILVDQYSEQRCSQQPKAETPKSLPTDECINTMWYARTVEAFHLFLHKKDLNSSIICNTNDP